MPGCRPAPSPIDNGVSVSPREREEVQATAGRQIVEFKNTIVPITSSISIELTASPKDKLADESRRTEPGPGGCTVTLGCVRFSVLSMSAKTGKAPA